MALNLITTKLRAPRLSQSVVERPHLHQRLEAGLEAALILISAPAGSGKSTLLGSWLARLDRPTAWLTLGAGEDDLERFLLYLIGALQQLEPSLGAGLQDVLESRSSVEVEPLVIRLINDVVQLGRDVLLVLDDYHVISSPKVHDAVEFLLDHMPQGLCLVISTRADPPLALSRLRVRGQLVEVRADDLRFSVEEATTFLNDRQGLQLSSKAVASLEERTEGWIAGLQLAALSLEGRKDKEGFVAEFAGSHRYLVDYLMDEVLDRQIPEVRTFLQRTAILERFTASLCEAVSGQPDGQGLLEQIEAANLFLVPLDDERRWYRYQHLFADFLRLRLRESEGQEIPELHRRASAWLEQEGWNDEAIAHALAANDVDRAGRLVENIAFKLGVYWNNTQLIKYVSGLPLELLATLPRLCIYYSWALINTGQVAAVAAFAPVLEQSAASARQLRAVTACVITLRAYQRVWRMEFADAAELCQEALAVLEDSGAEPASDEERWLRVAATNLIAYSYLHSDVAKADAFYPVALERSQRLGNFVGTANGFARHGRVKHRLGQLHAAWEVFRTGLGTLERWQTEGGRRVVNVAELHLNLTRLLHEWNRLDEALEHLHQAKALNELSQFPPVVALEHRAAFELHLALGDLGAAQASLGRLDQLAREVHQDNLFYRQLFGALAMNLRLRLASIAPGLEHLRDEVAGWVLASGLKADDTFGYPSEESYHVIAHLLLVHGRAAEALGLLKRLVQAAQAEGRNDDLIRYRILQALGHRTLGQADQAVRALTEALELAEPQGYCRSFVDAGPALRELLGQVSGHERVGPYAQRLLAAFGPSPVLANKPTPPPSDLELVSERELAVLRLMAGGQTYKEIARVLSLSPNTVRWYMQSLNSKLRASNRVEAVNRARELGLL